MEQHPLDSVIEFENPSSARNDSNYDSLGISLFGNEKELSFGKKVKGEDGNDENERYIFCKDDDGDETITTARSSEYLSCPSQYTSTSNAVTMQEKNEGSLISSMSHAMEQQRLELLELSAHVRRLEEQQHQQTVEQKRALQVEGEYSDAFYGDGLFALEPPTSDMRELEWMQKYKKSQQVTLHLQEELANAQRRIEMLEFAYQESQDTHTMDLDIASDQLWALTDHFRRKQRAAQNQNPKDDVQTSLLVQESEDLESSLAGITLNEETLQNDVSVSTRKNRGNENKNDNTSVIKALKTRIGEFTTKISKLEEENQSLQDQLKSSQEKVTKLQQQGLHDTNQKTGSVPNNKHHGMSKKVSSHLQVLRGRQHQLIINMQETISNLRRERTGLQSEVHRMETDMADMITRF